MVQNNALNNSSSTFQVGTNPAAVSTSLPLTIGFNQNASTGVEISNTTTGTGSQAFLECISDVGGALIVASSSTNSVTRWAGRTEYTDGNIGSGSNGNGVNLTTTTAAGDIRFYVQGNVQAASIDTNSNLNCNNIVASASNTHTVISAADTAAHSTTPGPVLDLYRNVTAAATDTIGQITYTGNNTTPAKKTFASTGVTIDTATAASESASWRLATISAGTLTNQIVALNTGCQVRGNNANTTPPTGYMGETISSLILAANAVSVTTGQNITSIVLSAGTWTLGGYAGFTGITTGTVEYASISPNTASGSLGSQVRALFTSTAAGDILLALPTLTVTVAASTNYYLVASTTVSSGTPKGYGNLFATRVG